MNFLETLHMAIRAVLLNKVRSFLTMLGVIIGVGAVIMLVALGTGLQQYITGEFDQLGSNVLIIMPGDIFDSGGGFNQEGQITALTNNKLAQEDVVNLQRLRPLITAVAPLQLASGTVSFQQAEEDTTIIGTTEQYTQARPSPLQKGEFFSQDEVKRAEKVAVIGNAISEELFQSVDPIGKRIRIENQTFIVKGVFEKQGGGMGGPQFDTYAYIPQTTYKQMFDNEAIYEIIVKAKDGESVPEAIVEIEKTLGKRLDDDEFSVIETTEILNTINSILGVLTLGLGGIAAISLIVGGIGIMNIMLVSVTERTKEIGLRKALGATPRQILLQFLIESGMISLIGGMIGVGIAFGASLIINQFFPAVVTGSAVLLAFSVSVTIGIVFGVAPARRASKLSPIEALRYE